MLRSYHNAITLHKFFSKQHIEVFFFFDLNFAFYAVVS